MPALATLAAGLSKSYNQASGKLAVTMQKKAAVDRAADATFTQAKETVRVASVNEPPSTALKVGQPPPAAKTVIAPTLNNRKTILLAVLAAALLPILFLRGKS